MKKIAIVGGGVSGLVAMYYLEKFARESGREVECTLIESAPRLGGKIFTLVNSDFTMEGGPDSFITRKPWAYELTQELGMGEQIVPINPAARSFHIVRNARLIPYPTAFHLGISRNLRSVMTTSLLSPSGKFRYVMERFCKPRTSDHDESLADFFSRHFGNEAMETIFSPLLAGVYAGDPERMSMQSYYPWLLDHEAVWGSLIKAVSRETKAEEGIENGQHKPALFVSHKDGMQGIIKALAAKIKGQIWLDQRVIRINRSAQDGYEIIAVPRGVIGTFDTLIMTTPAYVADKLIGAFDPILSGMLGSLRHVSSTLVCLGFTPDEFTKSSQLASGGFLVPRQERRRIIGGSWLSNKFPGRAPHNGRLLRIFIGGDGMTDWADASDAEITAIVTNEINEIMGITARPIIQHIFRWPQGNPIYDVGHQYTMNIIEKQVKKIPGLYLTGSSYRGVGIPDCIYQAKQLAKNLIAQ